MKSLPVFYATDEPIELPPGFRFHPTDEELITHYLSPKVIDNSFNAVAIGEVALNKVEPWDLPWKAKMGEKEWYFFCTRDRKYPTGLRTNRATLAGYWKATGKDKEIFRAKFLVGMKKTLVFYRGRAPKGAKTNWVMHEYRLEGKHSLLHISQDDKSEWVICRIFNKNSAGESDLPPLKEVSSDENHKSPSFRAEESSRVTCFPEPAVDLRDTSLSPLPLIFPRVSDSGSVLLDGDEDRDFSNLLNAQVDLECLWNY